ncbi:MAG: calcium-binding protein [Betaproteobacteria bacterium]
MEGGTGLDIYTFNGKRELLGVVSSNDGSDVIQDIDGKGVLRYLFQDGVFANPTSTVIADASVQISSSKWQSVDGKVIYTKIIDPQSAATSLLISLQGDAGGSITLENFRDGDFGIHLWEARQNLTTNLNVFGDRAFLDADPSTPKIDKKTDALGNYVITNEVDVGVDDLLFGDRPGAVVDPNTPGEKFDAGAGNDSIYADRPRGQADNGLGNADWILGGLGRDWIEAGAGNDLIEAGSDGILNGEIGGDVVDAGAGDDEIYAQEKVDLASAILQGNNNAPTNSKGDFISGGAGKDRIIGGASNDVLLGGGDQDLILGGAGNDDIWGDSGYIAQSFSWTATRTITTTSDLRTYHDELEGVVAADDSPGASDTVYGGAGQDWIFAGAGDDFVDGGADDDVLFGEAGSDTLIGGAGNDVLNGDNYTIVLGADEGADYLDGGAGDDYLQGDGGDDVLVGGSGNDTLAGGTGKDIYLFNKGDGIDTIIDTPEDAKSADASVLVLGEGFFRLQVIFRVGSLLVDLGPSDASDPNSSRDMIHFENFNPQDPYSTVVIGEIRFADGSSMTYTDIMAQGFDIDGTQGNDDGHDGDHAALTGTAVTDRIRGFDGNDVLAGCAGDDMLDGGAGDDLLDGGDGDDILIGGPGADHLQGRAGDDTYQIDAADEVVDDEGANTIIFVDNTTLDDISVAELSTSDGAFYTFSIGTHVVFSQKTNATARGGT